MLERVTLNLKKLDSKLKIHLLVQEEEDKFPLVRQLYKFRS